MPCRVRPADVHPFALRDVEVLHVADVTPGMRRVTFTGEQLLAHTTREGVEQAAFLSTAFDDGFRFFLPQPGRHMPVPNVVDGSLEFPAQDRPLARAYTVRRFDTATGLLEVDFVVHGAGVASTWAERAVPGDRVHLAGPWSSAAPPSGFDWWFVVGDETALPAIARLLDEAPVPFRAQIVVEVAEASHRQTLREVTGVEVTWLVRADTTDRLLDAVRAAAWWDGAVFAWVAGEQSVVRDIRRHLIADRGVTKDAIDSTGYWKRERGAGRRSAGAPAS